MANHNVDRVGEQIGPYRLTRLLGAGGFGEVYEAEHRLIQQKRAIKLLRERHFHDPKQRERFLREARTLAALEHPNILPVLEVDEAGTILYLVLPLYQRGTLPCTSAARSLLAANPVHGVGNPANRLTACINGIQSSSFASL